ncbi:MAG TPA: choice-of-anchor tandem repeat GloVer-containing protein [Candidatus Sulfotelmatobacter sp.]|nr:choice-of-anchor tandem repeat GloVer-containing protein [Candidatus Sulfotelmatobacter sp.]
MPANVAACRFSMTRILILTLLLGGFSLSAAAQSSFTTLVTFEGTNGNGPFAPLIQGSDGNFYGTTCCGGATGYGVVFQVNSVGTLNVLYNFCSQANCADGESPWGGLVQAQDGSFYGTTLYGGANNCGTVFNLTSTGTLTTVVNFDCNSSTGGYPYAGLLLGKDGNLYGSTSYSAVNGSTVFRLTLNGELTVLHTFCQYSDNCSDGLGAASVLVQDANGTLYGSTQSGGGPNGSGTVFKITPDGTETVLHSFCIDSNCSDGARPNAVLLGSDGNIYGTTYGGGNDFAGTVFTISSVGQFNTLYQFSPQSQTGDVHPSNPYAGLIQATDGNFYGTTYVSNTSAGTAYSITPAGVLTLLHNFASTEGEFPQSSLIQGADGNFYGTAAMGGDMSCAEGSSFGCGTVFSLTATASGKKAATTTTLISSANPSKYRQLVKFTATVGGGSKGAPQGKITFKSGRATLGTATLNASGQAVLNVSTLTVGAHSVVASYAGNSKYLASQSTAMTQTVR